MVRNRAIVVVIAGMAAACAGNPGPGEPGYPFNLQGVYSGEVLIEGEAYGVTMDLATGPGGVLDGSYQVTSPIRMAGSLNGALVADTVTFTLSYTNPMDGCGGTLDGTGTVAEGRQSFSGRASVNDSCGGYLSGTFMMRRE